MRNYMRTSSSIAALLGTAFLLPNLAQAQLEEVVVTATKRGAVNIQDAAYNISAVDGDFLNTAGAEDFYGFARRTGIQAEDEGPGEKRFIIRGLKPGG